MIEYVRGLLAELTPTQAVVEAAGIGYGALISLATYEKLFPSAQGQVKLLVHEVIREDQHTLYGFFEPREREMFRLLIGVSGVGPSTALLILSAMRIDELELCIASADHARLKTVKGVGAKTAQRITVDLKDKIDTSVALGAEMGGGEPSLGAAYDDALASLVALGFARPASQKALRRIFDADPTLKVEAAIKKALAMM